MPIDEMGNENKRGSRGDDGGKKDAQSNAGCDL